MEKLAKITHRGDQKEMKASPSLGVVRLDYDYPPAPGDIDSAETFGYNVYYRVVPGLTFDMCQAGELEGDVKSRFIEAIEVRYMFTYSHNGALTPPDPHASAEKLRNYENSSCILQIFYNRHSLIC